MQRDRQRNLSLLIKMIMLSIFVSATKSSKVVYFFVLTSARIHTVYFYTFMYLITMMASYVIIYLLISSGFRLTGQKMIWPNNYSCLITNSEIITY